jgi:hypothetical protein
VTARAFAEREAPPVAHDPVCVYCGDPTTAAADLCDGCYSVHDLAGDHPRRCICGFCVVFAKIEARRAAVRL